MTDPLMASLIVFILMISFILVLFIVTGSHNMMRSFMVWLTQFNEDELAHLQQAYEDAIYEAHSNAQQQTPPRVTHHTQEIVQQAQTLKQVEEETLRYKQKQMAHIDKTVKDVVETISTKVLQQSISKEEQERLIIQALENAKKELMIS